MRATILAALMLGGCVTTGTGPTAGTSVPVEGDSIRLATGPCYGTCPVYAVSVTPDGRGTFEGKQHTAVTGVRDFTVTPAQYARLAALLAPYRPQSGTVRYSHGEPNCGNAPTDMPSTEVTWTRMIGDSQSLYFYHGCRVGNEGLATALEGAPTSLPIQAFIGPRG